MKRETTRKPREYEVLVDGRKIATVVREPTVAPPNWMVVTLDGCGVVAWRHTKREAIEEARRRLA